MYKCSLKIKPQFKQSKNSSKHRIYWRLLSDTAQQSKQMLLCAYNGARQRNARIKRDGAHHKRKTIANCYKCASQAQGKSEICTKRKRTTNARCVSGAREMRKTQRQSGYCHHRRQRGCRQRRSSGDSKELARLGWTKRALGTQFSNIAMQVKIWIDKIHSLSKERERAHGQTQRQKHVTHIATNTIRYHKRVWCISATTANTAFGRLMRR